MSNMSKSPIESLDSLRAVLLLAFIGGFAIGFIVGGTLV